MTLYDLMLKTNFELISGMVLCDEDKQKIVNQFLFGLSRENTVKHFHQSVNAPEEKNGDSRQMYPIFYIPPYNDGKKHKTITTVTAKTHILSANSYELEIIRLLAVLSPEDKRVQQMLDKTKSRLDTSCFGNFCYMGECFESSIVVLRLYATAFPNETAKIRALIDGIKAHMNDKKRHSGTLFYYWLCLSELPVSIAKSELESYKDELLKLINRSFVMNSQQDKYLSPLYKYIIRNCLSIFDEYTYIKDRQPYLSEKDGRLNFSLEVK